MRLSRNHNEPGAAAAPRGPGGAGLLLLALGVAAPAAAAALPQGPAPPAAARPPGTPAPAGRAAGGEARARHLMGTRLLIETAGPAAGEAAEAAFAEVARLELVLSNWRADSEVWRLNREGAAAWVICSTDLMAALGSALDWARATGGAFDPTVEPLIRGLGLRSPGLAPPGAPVPVAADRAAPGRDAPIGWRHVRLDPGRGAARFDAAGVAVDFGGIGKGIALDAAARALLRHGVGAALLDFGGQVLATGPPPGAEGWSVGIADPDDRERAVAAVVIAAGSLSTSGNGGRPEGAGHILDPAAGRPAPFAGSVTVWAPDATSADALSTALFVMGPERGLRFARRRGLEAIYLWREEGGALAWRATRRFDGLIRNEGPDGRSAVTLR